MADATKTVKDVPLSHDRADETALRRSKRRTSSSTQLRECAHRGMKRLSVQDFSDFQRKSVHAERFLQKMDTVIQNAMVYDGILGVT